MAERDSQSPNINFFARREDRERLERLSRKLSLSKSEVARRSLRLGLDKLEKITLPGGQNEAKAELSGAKLSKA